MKSFLTEKNLKTLLPQTSQEVTEVCTSAFLAMERKRNPKMTALL